MAKKQKPQLIELRHGELTLNGTPVNEIIKSGYRQFKRNKKTGKNEIHIGNVTLVTQNDRLKQLDNNTLALFIYIVMLLTKTTDNQIAINIKDYAAFSGYNVYQEDKAKAKAELDKFRRYYNAALNNLKSLWVSWIDTKHGKATDEYTDKSLLTGTRLKASISTIEVNRDLTEPLRNNNYITSIPQNATKLGIGATKGYTQGYFKLSQQYNMAKNKEHDTHNIVSIETFREWIGLPSIEHLKSINNRNYTTLILQPIEKQLDEYIKNGDLLLYEYVKSKKEKPTQEELDTTPIEQQIKKWYIHFEFVTDKYPTIEAWNRYHK